ncbi:DGQHR domain-containing protein [Xanthomonas campestris]|uniref:DGQHR domain-containing protein n=1 Tax=Xanthomonas campestris TaxID=339 RepID=UPI001CD245AF|nr:DGQHR domain-containing protein [Xanthomonas campestris]MEA9705857.1 DGQHR domain-containing protein [Xanthomonas campestris pv. raphani]
MKQQSVFDDNFKLELPCVRVSQPIGDFYIASISYDQLIQITISDVRRMAGEREVDEYLGIQREVNQKRVTEIGDYVNTVDACFPTAVILSVKGSCALYDETARILTLKNDLESSPPILLHEIAHVLDGQHRIEGLKHLKPGHPAFDVNVSIFVDMDIENQAYLFSVVNLAQTKVNKSLVYDLFDYSRSRSPQKTAHSIAVALDQAEDSPFKKRIKRLGVATRGRFTETLTQATFVEALLPYFSEKPNADRDLFKRGKVPAKADANQLRKVIFRNMFIDEMDMEIADIIYNYFSAVQEKWPTAWNAGGDGAMLNKTNGFKALMKLLRPLYLRLATPGELVSKESFSEAFAKSNLKDSDFTVDNYKPGTSGEAALYRDLFQQLSLEKWEGR